MSMGRFDSWIRGSEHPCADLPATVSGLSAVGVPVRSHRAMLPFTAAASDGFTSGADPGGSAAS